MSEMIVPESQLFQMENSNYIFYEKIGTGSFGQVFRGKCRRSGNQVAIKVIRKIDADVTSLNQECIILKGMQHPNIIRMYDSYETASELVVVLEYAKESLYSLLKKSPTKKLPPNQVRRIACDLVSALHYLHSLRIFHRDIKPQNVLIGEDGVAKLCDFGFARKIDPTMLLLTSFKGTPLYMAPEVMGGKPYDHSADLWSLGCILYELLVGNPPYLTGSLTDLANMLRTKDIYWPSSTRNESRSFLQRLLEKDPNKRLPWPELLKHDYLNGRVHFQTTDGLSSPLTKALSPSQELVKGKQREYLEQEILLRGRIEMHKKFIAQGGFSRTKLPGSVHHFQGGPQIPNLFIRPSTSNGFALQGVHPPRISPVAMAATNRHLRLQPQQSTFAKPVEDREQSKLDSGGSSCETLTSSDSDDSTSDDGRTVIVENCNRERKVSLRYGVVKKVEDSYLHEMTKLNLRDGFTNCASPDKGAIDLMKSEALFTLHSFGSEDKPIESDEWVDFLTSTAKEASHTPIILCEKHFLTMIVAPLRNHHASTIVVKKIADLLAMPFLNQEQNFPGLIKNLETLYMEIKVVPNLLYACKLILRRRRIKSNSSSIDLDDIASSLTEEDLDAMDKCLRLVCFLVYSEQDFVIQFCDSVCVLQTSLILQVFLSLDKQKSRMTTQTLALLSQVLRTIPSNTYIVEDIFLDGKTEPDELWRLLEHSNPLIQAKSLRLLFYLNTHSNKIKEYFHHIQSKRVKLMLLLRNISSQQDVKVKEAATLVVQSLSTSMSTGTTRPNNGLELH